MQVLRRINLVQFFLYEAESFEIEGDTAFLGPNGTGKTVLLDAVQIAMLGAHGHYVRLNAQKEGTNSRPRKIMDYCLGALDGNVKREVAQSYVCLVFEDTKTRVRTSVGINMIAAKGDIRHETKGMFVARDCDLVIQDFLEPVAGGHSPMRWEDFRTELRKKVDKRDAKPQFHDTPEAYVREMLAALCTTRRLDAAAFMTSFHKSLLLRSIDSVDEFVRNFLVDARKIDRQAAAAQIQRFEELRKLVADTKAQIAELDSLGNDFKVVKAASERAAGYNALAATLRYDDCAERQAYLQEEVESLEKEDAEGQQKLKQIRERLAQLEAEEKAALAAVNASEPLKAMQQAEQTLEQMKGQLPDLTRPIERVVNNLDMAVSDLLADPDVAKDSGTSRDIAKQIRTVRDHLTAMRLEPAKTLLTSALHAGRQLAAPLERLVDNAKLDLERAEEDLKGLESRRRQSDKYGVALSSDTSRAIERLDLLGIKAIPVCSVVRMTDAAWQWAQMCPP